MVHVWDAVLHLHLHTFKGHKDTITVSERRSLRSNSYFLKFLENSVFY